MACEYNITSAGISYTEHYNRTRKTIICNVRWRVVVLDSGLFRTRRYKLCVCLLLEVMVGWLQSRLWSSQREYYRYISEARISLLQVNKNY